MDDTPITQRPTGIDALDTLLRGGIPEGHVVLLSGDSGTGKTILSTEWLFRGYTQEGENGLYLTLTESVTEATQNLRSMDYYREDAVGEDGVHFADLRTTVEIFGLRESELGSDDIDKLVDAIEQLVEDTDAERLVIDSITAIGYLLEDRDLIRTFIFRLGTMLSSHDVTTLLTSEVSGGGYSVYGVEEFISDAIVTLEQEQVAGDMRRTLQVVKMRGIGYDSAAHQFVIDDSGIHLFLIDYPLTYEASEERTTSGVPGLDNVIGGGIRRNTTTLVAGPSGSGKTLTGLHFTNAGIKGGETCIYVSFEESASLLHQMARNFGWALEEAVERNQLILHTISPNEAYPEQHLDTIRRLIEENDADRLVVDSMTAIQDAYTEEDHKMFARRLSLMAKHHDTTTLVTANQDNMAGSAATRTNVSSIADNILILNAVEAEGTIKYSLATIKTRSSDHDRSLREYTIQHDGIRIGAPMSGYEGVMTGSARKIGTTAEERLQKAFTDVLGPIGSEEFAQVREQGLTADNVREYIDTLPAEGIISQEKAEAFKERATAIIRGEDAPAPADDEEPDGPEEEQTESFLERLRDR